MTPPIFAKVVRLRGIVIAAIIAMNIGACTKEDYAEITFHELEEKWEESGKHSVSSWWYLGDDKRFHYLEERRGMGSMGYKIKIGEVKLVNIEPRAYSVGIDDPINLKDGNLDFHPGS